MSKKTAPSAVFHAVHPHAAGIDVGNFKHYVAVSPDSCAEGESCVRHFDTFTCDLLQIADWLAPHQVTTVALESTGIYWILLFEVLESRGFEVCLVDTRRLKSVPGRKSDVKDCQWLQQLHTFGLLHSAFRPQEEICVLRTYLRQREMLIANSGQHIQHMQKALQQMNVKLSNVLSDITGTSGMLIIQAILNGERDPVKLTKHRDPRCKNPEQAPLPPKKSKKNAHSPDFDARSLLYRATGVDLTLIPGIEANTALKVISEIGRDIDRWPTVKHFTSWLCLCPGNKTSGGRVLNSRTRSSNNRAAAALRMAAQSLERTKTALGAFFRRIKIRKGAPKAITATAHKLARLIYFMLKKGEAYVDIGQEAYEAQYRNRMVESVRRRAAQLGYHLLPTTGM